MTKKVLKKDKTVEIKTKTGGTYSYKFATLAQIHKYLEETGQEYYAFIAPVFHERQIPIDALPDVLSQLKDDDYMWIQKLDKDGKPSGNPIRGAKIKWSDNVQEYGGSLTSARRYSLLMAYGLACEDDPVPSMPPTTTEPRAGNRLDFEQVKAALLKAKTDEQVDLIKTKILKQYPKLTDKQRAAINRMCAERKDQIEFGDSPSKFKDAAAMEGEKK